MTRKICGNEPVCSPETRCDGKCEKYRHWRLDVTNLGLSRDPRRNGDRATPCSELLIPQETQCSCPIPLGGSLRQLRPVYDWWEPNSPLPRKPSSRLLPLLESKVGFTLSVQESWGGFKKEQTHLVSRPVEWEGADSRRLDDKESYTGWVLTVRQALCSTLLHNNNNPNHDNFGR